MTLAPTFDNSYARLPERFFVRQAPEPVAAPQLLALNRGLAVEMGLDPAWLASPDGVSALAGNSVPKGAAPLAQAYAGHQFGNFVPQLGDGRALLLGEVVGPDGRRWDIQLKGSGRTPFSRMGDGRAWLGPVLREYLVSEAMAALGAPTTRALAAVATGEPVWRETRLPGAVLCRVAGSHVRVGTFQYFAARRDIEALRVLADHAGARHFPDADGPLGLLQASVAAQARLVARWMGLGFVHGVMNTDNTHVGGLTIDYGPCAFLDAYHPETVFSSIDHAGRYAYGNQPRVAVWNLAQFAVALLPLLGEGEAAQEAAQAAVDAFAPAYEAAWAEVFRAKLGLRTAEPGDIDLIATLLVRMAEAEADFTRCFRGLADGSARAEFSDPGGFDAWQELWVARLAREGEDRDTAPSAALAARLRAANPAIIPRNHRIEAAIAAAVTGDLGPARRLETALARPFEEPSTVDADLTLPPKPSERVAETFCGT